MKQNANNIMEAQRRAYNRLAMPVQQGMKLEGRKVERTLQENDFYVNKKSITAPAMLIQEQAFTNTKQTFEFDFSINGTNPTAVLNNIKLPQNNIAAIYGIQLLIGQGDTANNRQYFSTGFAPNDNSIYNSIFTLQVETDTVINNLEGQMFNEVPEVAGMLDQTSSMVLINPIRILSGKMGIFKMNITLKNSISTLVLTPSLFLSMRLHCVMGQASA